MKQGEYAMRVAIIGTGSVGSAIARGLKGKGHQVILGARDPQAAEVAGLADATEATPLLPAAAAEAAELVILALPWGVAEGAIKALGPLAGKTVIDCMNPLGMVQGAFGLTVGHTTSGAEIVQGCLPDAHVVKTLNQVGAEIMARNETLARAMTIIETAKLNGLDPQAYLADVLDRIHDHKINRLDELLPWKWTPVAAAQAKAA